MMFDGEPPEVLDVQVNVGHMDPADLPSGPQPTSWAQQRSDIRTVQVRFTEPVAAVSPADLRLIHLGTDPESDEGQPIPLSFAQMATDGDAVTLTFEAGELPDGTYRLVVFDSVTDTAGNPLDGNGDGIAGDVFVLTGNATNRFYKNAADFNGDGGVSLFDFPTFQYWFGHAVPPAPEYLDLNGDGIVSLLDFPAFQSQFGGLVETPTPESSPPGLQAELLNDSGVSATDLLTTDPSIAGTVLDDSDLLLLRAALGEQGQAIWTDISFLVDENGGFELDASFLEFLHQGVALGDGPMTVMVQALDGFGNKSEVTVEFELDATAPATPTFGLASASRLRPDTDALTELATVDLVGLTDPDAEVSVHSPSMISTADGAGQFTFSGLPVGLGLTPFITSVTDDAGNVSTFTLSIARVETGDSFMLAEADRFVTERSQLIELGQAEGGRTLSFNINAAFDITDTDPAVEDLLLVYLRDPQNPGATLLDRGRQGTALFSLAGEEADFQPGTVRFNGTTVEVDLTSLGSETEGLLVFQLINSDTDEGTEVTVESIANVLDEAGGQSPVLPLTPTSPATDSVLDVDSFASAPNVDMLIENLRLNAEAGQFVADLKLLNRGQGISRNVAVLFEGLPAGVELTNASGVDASGNPYLNLQDLVGNGGLDAGELTTPVELLFDNPDHVPFSLHPRVLTTGPNQPPEFNPPDPLTMTAGQILSVELGATDPDGDRVTYSIISGAALPPGELSSEGHLAFFPGAADVGTYDFVLIASDGFLQTSQALSLTVEADPVTTTRVSGRLLDTNAAPIPGVLVELSGESSTTDALGEFQIEFTGGFPSDTLLIRGETFPGPETYPFVAEKLGLILGRDPLEGVNNVVERPIYLPVLDVAGGTVIDPGRDITLEQEILPGEIAAVEVAAGTLLMDDGSGGMVPFDGVLSITEVPAERTPAALPEGHEPDVVVTIQPAEMVFTQPAPLTLPNLSGFPADSEFDLLSINPETGQFDVVGQGGVSPDGLSIVTTEGGILNSSWHYFIFSIPVPQPNVTRPNENSKNTKPRCATCPTHTADSNSEVETFTGHLLETHDLVSYQSQGQTRGLQLAYDSGRVEPRQRLFTSAQFDPSVDPTVSLSLTVEATVNLGGFAVDATAGPIEFGSSAETRTAGGATPVNTSGLPSGRHTVSIATSVTTPPRVFRCARSGGGVGVVNTGRSCTPGEFRSVRPRPRVDRLVFQENPDVFHTIDSPFGAGWGLSGLRSALFNSDGSAFLVNGDGSELTYERPATPGDPFGSPDGDFSTFVRNGDGTSTRTMTDLTVEQYYAAGRMTSITDRNGNPTQFEYTDGVLSRMTDPVGLETIFTSRIIADGSRHITLITDPAGKQTHLRYDSRGNLIEIEDPDSTTRQFQYDSMRHLVGEIDQRGATEQTFYSEAGRIARSIRKDGTEMQFFPVQDQRNIPLPDEGTTGGAIALVADANGNLSRFVLDRAGQLLVAEDTEGPLPTTDRKADNLVSSITDARAFATRFTYDDRGNVLTVTDEIDRRAQAGGALFPAQLIRAGSIPMDVVTADLNGDGFVDMAVVNHDKDAQQNQPGDVSIFLGNGDGTFQPEQRVQLAETSTVVHGPFAISAGDFNSDGAADLVTANRGTNNVSILLGNGDGTFDVQPPTPSSGGVDVTTGDFNGDGVTDLAVPGADRVELLLGNGDGSFALSDPTPPTGSFPFAVTTGDFNDDGITDLATANVFTHDVSVFLGNGDATFVAQPTLPVEERPGAIASADLDGDGFEDIIAANNALFNTRTASVLFGRGDGTFDDEIRINVGTIPLGVDIADLNGDGHLDFVTANRSTTDVSVVLGNGDRTFQPEVRYPAGLGTVDLINGTFAGPEEVVIADFNGDGVGDLAVPSNLTNDVSILLGHGDGTFAVPLRINTQTTPVDLSTADFNGDGFPDIALANLLQSDSLLLGDGQGGFQHQLSNSIVSRSTAVVHGDFNGDELLDLAFSDQFSDIVHVFPGNGDGTFMPDPAPDATGDGPAHLVTADFNGDGELDLATANQFSNDIHVLLGDGMGDFAPDLNPLSAGDGASYLAAADFNDDGAIDLASTSQNDNGVLVYFGAGDGTFQPGQLILATISAMSVVAGDFNGDGVPDLTTGNASSDIAVALSNSDGTFQTEQLFTVGGGPEPTTGDFNGDGLLDIATSNAATDDVSVLLGNGDGTFTTEHRFKGGDEPRGITAADFNGDGATDLAFGNYLDSDITVLLNVNGRITNGLATPLRFTYDNTFSQVTGVTDQLGRLTLYEIDPANGDTLSTTQVIGEVDDAMNGETDDLVTSFTYTPQGLTVLSPTRSAA